MKKAIVLQALAAVLGLGLLAPMSAQAVITADQMTCAEAIAYYAAHKRLWVVTGGGDTVPLYGMTPVAEQKNLKCKGHHKAKRSYWVRTLDKKSCTFAVYCQ